VVLAALAAGVGGGVAVAATQGSAKQQVKTPTPVQAPARPAEHHCHNAVTVAAL
jgi:hypothetical protein